MTAIVFVLFPGVTQLDMTGPAQVLSRLPDARVTVAAVTRDPVATDSGFALLPTATFADSRDAAKCSPAVADASVCRVIR